ncbi:hypothetical protein R3P38DRAFT_3222837 [Favolaschia claudopus]|uniref:Uncharacterized protein n=1 Tax=Favolaschia claudopus TaxID=2862362 RepID=A0AAV9ZXH6_9AGAR
MTPSSSFFDRVFDAEEGAEIWPSLSLNEGLLVPKHELFHPAAAMRHRRVDEPALNAHEENGRLRVIDVLTPLMPSFPSSSSLEVGDEVGGRGLGSPRFLDVLAMQIFFYYPSSHVQTCAYVRLFPSESFLPSVPFALASIIDDIYIQHARGAPLRWCGLDADDEFLEKEWIETEQAVGNEIFTYQLTGHHDYYRISVLSHDARILQHSPPRYGTPASMLITAACIDVDLEDGGCHLCSRIPVARPAGKSTLHRIVSFSPPCTSPSYALGAQGDLQPKSTLTTHPMRSRQTRRCGRPWPR